MTTVYMLRKEHSSYLSLVKRSSYDSDSRVFGTKRYMDGGRADLFSSQFQCIEYDTAD